MSTMSFLSKRTGWSGWWKDGNIKRKEIKRLLCVAIEKVIASALSKKYQPVYRCVKQVRKLKRTYGLGLRTRWGVRGR